MLGHFLKIISYLILVALCQCSYRFTNSHIYVPYGTRSIAIAPIFDSGRTVIPHDLLWSSLQQAFASNGHLVVKGVQNADLFLQAHLKDSSVVEYDSDTTSKIQKTNMFLDGSGRPFFPNSYVNVRTADIFSKRERVSFNVEVEIWNLNSKKLLLKKEYPLSNNFNMSTITSTKESLYIRNEETLEFVIDSIAQDFARRVVDDLYTLSEFTTPPKDPLKLKSKN